ncbi:Mss4-like protein [Melampsora americana]|nr:Mss4-like protein [Melampsora americana]
MGSSSPTNLFGSCFCENVQYIIDITHQTQISNHTPPNLKKEPGRIPENLTLTAYCHCTNCQRLNGSPFVWTTHWKEDSLRWLNSTKMIPFNHLNEGLPDTLEIYESMPGRKYKLRCKKCGSPVGSYSIIKKEWTIWGTTFERFKSDENPSDDSTSKIKGWDLIKPNTHIFYGTRIMDIVDELSKWTGYEGQSEKLG